MWPVMVRVSDEEVIVASVLTIDESKFLKALDI